MSYSENLYKRKYVNPYFRNKKRYSLSNLIKVKSLVTYTQLQSRQHLTSTYNKTSQKVRPKLQHIGKKKSNIQNKDRTKTQYLIKKSMILKGTSKVKLLSGRIRFKYGFVVKVLNTTFTIFSISMITQFVKCFEVMRSLVKLSVSFKINSIKYAFLYSASSP